MTSVSITSAAAARIRRLLVAEGSESNRSPSWRRDADCLQQALEKASQTLKMVRDEVLKPGDTFIKLERQIVQLAYEIDDSIATATALIMPSNPRAKFANFLQGSTQEISSKLKNLHDLISEIQTINSKKLEQRPSVGAHAMSMNYPEPATLSASTQNDLPPSMENEVRSAVLDKDLPVVCIWGKSGMGKSTLAKQVYHHSEIRQSFKVFAWVLISPDFQTRMILQRILEQLLPDRKSDIKGMDEIELAEEIFIVQTEKRCLVVLEDVETVADWEGIRIAFPIGQSISKIVIITSSEEVAKEAAGVQRGVHHVRPLTEPECFRVLKEKADFDEEDWNDMGRAIHDLSGGSPLTAVILGKSLKTVGAVARAQLLNEIDYCPIKSENSAAELPILRLSYRCLPHEMKPCFLYMGQFPENHEILVENLYHFLAAEDLALSMDSVTKSLETVYNFGLVDVQEDQVSKTKTYKSCRLHKKIRNLSVSQGVDEDFFEIVEFGSEKRLKRSTRRLALYLNKCNGKNIPFDGPDMAKKIRSLIILDALESENKSTWPQEMNDLKEFSSLRILFFDGVNFEARKVPRGIGKLVLLRYLSFRGCFLQIFPSNVIKLPFLETLDLRVTDCKMIIPDVLSNMKKLRHLYFPEQYESENENCKLRLEGLGLLEVLVNFDTGACNIEDLSKLTKVQILTATSDGNRKDLDPIVDYLDGNPVNLQESSLNISNFDFYRRDRAHEVIKKLLECKSLHGLHIEGLMDRLPGNISISETISDLFLDGLELEDDPMGVLGKAENLRSLVLVNDACVADEITFLATSEFTNLRVLKLKTLQYLEKLTFERGTLPKLSTLVIENCEDLEEVLIPMDLNNRLEDALEEKGDDLYLVEPLPSLY